MSSPEFTARKRNVNEGVSTSLLADKPVNDHQYQKQDFLYLRLETLKENNLVKRFCCYKYHSLILKDDCFKVEEERIWRILDED